LRAELSDSRHALIGTSSTFVRMTTIVDQIAARSETVLLTG